MQPYKYQPNINSGQFRNRITIQKLTGQEDDLGQIDDKNWIDVKTVWAAIKTMQGREYYQAAATQSETTVRFIIRYTTGIDETMRVIYKGEVYQIVAPPINDDELNKTITIIAQS